MANSTPKLSDRHLAELGLLFALISIAGVGVPMIWPDAKAVGVAFVIFGLTGAILICCIWILRSFRRSYSIRQKMIPLIGMLVFGVGFIGCAAWFFWPNAQRELTTRGAQAAAETPRLENFFATDFPFLSLD